MNKKLSLLLTLSVLSITIHAQEVQSIENRVITLSDALTIALERNHNILIANNNAEINSNNTVNLIIIFLIAPNTLWTKCQFTVTFFTNLVLFQGTRNTIGTFI